MALVKAGVPWPVAERMSPAQLLGFRVIAGELEGGEFDWKGLKWQTKR
jgi:hypothetical protein